MLCPAPASWPGRSLLSGREGEGAEASRRGRARCLARRQKRAPVLGARSGVSLQGEPPDIRAGAAAGSAGSPEQRSDRFGARAPFGVGAVLHPPTKPCPASHCRKPAPDRDRGRSSAWPQAVHPMVGRGRGRCSPDGSAGCTPPETCWPCKLASCVISPAKQDGLGSPPAGHKPAAERPWWAAARSSPARSSEIAGDGQAGGAPTAAPERPAVDLRPGRFGHRSAAARSAPR